MGLWMFYCMLHSLMVPMFKSIFFMILYTYEWRFYFSMKLYTLIYKLANFHANRRTWPFHGLSGTMCGSLHNISEKSYQYKDGTWDILSRSVEKKNSMGLFKGCGKKSGFSKNLRLLFKLFVTKRVFFLQKSVFSSI